jgi:hypothetical protein
MQDTNQNNPEPKQFFDIKGPSNPDPTSRPVINNDPVQADPMVSSSSSIPISDGTQAPSEPVVNSPSPDPSQSISVKSDEPTLETAAQLGGAEPSEISYNEPAVEAKSEEPTSLPSLPTDASSTIETPEVTSPAPAPPVVPEEAVPSSEPVPAPALPETPPPSISEEAALTQPLTQPADHSASIVSNPIQETIKNEADAIAKAKSKKKVFNLNTIIGIFILVLLIVTAFIVYKYKIGK